MLTIQEYKIRGKSYLDNNWPEVIIATIIFVLFTRVSEPSREATSQIPLIATGLRIRFRFGAIVSILFSGPIRYGYAVFIRALRDRSADIGQVFDGFKRFKDTFLLYNISTILIMLWSLLLIVPGIIASISYTMAYLIMQDNPGISAMQAIEESKFMMDGHKMRYFEFSLSFLGWFLLSIVTLGLGFVYFQPYYKSAKVEFYEDLKRAANLEIDYQID